MFNINTVESMVKSIKDINIPYINAYYSTLGGKENVSILITISKQIREFWPSNILENTDYAKLHLYNDGTLECHCNSTGNKFRKTKVKSIEDLSNKLFKMVGGVQ